MADELDDLYAGKHSVVQEFFIKTADENYVTSRFCFSYGLDVDFFWNAVHALEKYLKAVLLLNGKSGKGRKVGGKQKSYGHDIVSLYAAVHPLAPELLPAKLARPVEIDPRLWSEETADQFVYRLYDMGNEHNRYQLTGYIRRQDDLWKLDLMVFAIRRLCQPLEAHFLGGKQEGVPDQSRRQRMVKDHPSSANLHSTLEKVFNGERGKFLKHIALNCNLPFAPEGYKHTRMVYGMASVNPVLVRRILEPLDSGDPEQEKEADELWQWVQDNIYLPPEYVKAYNAERSKRKAAAKNKQ